MVLRFGPQQNKQRQFTAALACMLFSVVALQTACGGKPSTPGTPAGSYTITVKGSDSSGTVVSAVTFPPLTVQ